VLKKFATAVTLLNSAATAAVLKDLGLKNWCALTLPSKASKALISLTL